MCDMILGLVRKHTRASDTDESIGRQGADAGQTVKIGRGQKDRVVGVQLG